MFKPLEGDEYSQRLKDKYSSCDDENIETVKREKLSQILFQSRPGPEAAGSTTTSSANESCLKKAVVAVGGDPVRVRSRVKCNKPCDGDDEFSKKNYTSVKTKRLCQLHISGGQALDPNKERKPVKRLSDISSIVDPDMVGDAMRKLHNRLVGSGCCGDNEEAQREVRDVTPDPDVELSTWTESPRDESGSFDNGFDDDDMEKPHFNTKWLNAKVPLVLSGEGETPVIQVPAILNQYLRDYQRDGIQFLYSHYMYDRGAILGDDMGLGKTVQVIGFLAALLGKQGNRVDVMKQKPRFIRKLSDSASVRQDSVPLDPFLIIGPGCVLYNWLDEFETWGYFNVRKFHGLDKAECLADIKKGKIEVVVTTFETFREHLSSLNSVSWEAVFADEVHKIKGLKAQTTKALRSIRTRRRYGLTGTALQNNILELWSIMDWAQPGCLGLQGDFQEEYVKAIEGGQRHDANKRELALARKKKEKFAEIRRGMMIRRTKALIADQLPRKDDNVVFCRLSQLQTSIYETILSHNSMQYVLNMHDPCPCDSGEEQSKCCYQKTKDGQSVKSLLFTFMHLLLKVGNHVALLIPTSKTSANQARHSRKICEVVLQQHQEFVQQTREASFKTLSNPKYCGKMKILQGLLKVFYNDHSKVLLFSYSTQVLDIIEQYLMSTGYEFRRIDGNVSSKKRMIIVREFNSDPNIFLCLISTRAGGLGLNLTGANKVVIFDPNWNPAHDLQAQDRAYRIGQRRNVQVYRLVTAGTIEENMYLRQIYKQQLLNISVEDGNARRYFYAVQGKQKGELFGVKNMFRLQTGESCLTMDILKRNERVESALAGFDVTKYIPPVMRVEDEEEDVEDADRFLPASEESEDYFAEFFQSQDIECKDKEIIDDSNAFKQPNCVPSTSDKSKRRTKEIFFEEDENQSDLDAKSTPTNRHCKQELKVCTDTSTKEKKSVKFESPKMDVPERRQGGKVRPSESKTGKGKLKTREVDQLDFAVDQTLAGTFSDVMDVFDNCGVVHIHENVKVVGGSRAEDHMTKCAMTDVYELHQNSQNLAVQCEPLSESSEEEPDTPDERQRKKGPSEEKHNMARSTVRESMKVLIGQTPKTFRMKQLEKMWQHHQCDSLIEFAELVLNSTVEERIRLLNEYYESQEPALKDIHVLDGGTSDQGRKQTSHREQERKPKGKLTSIAKKKQTAKHQRKKSHRPDQSIHFLNRSLSDSESLDKGDVKETAVITEQMESLPSSPYRDDDITPRRRQKTVGRKPCRKSKLLWKTSPHKPVPASYFDIGVVDSMEGELKPQYCKKRKSRGDSANRLLCDNAGQDGMDSTELLQEMQNLSEDSGNGHRKANRLYSSVSPIKCSQSKNVLHSKHGTSECSPTVSVLDDIFAESSKSKKHRKPPPNKRRLEDAGIEVNEHKSRSRYADEIFVDKASNIPDFLDTSTLRDEEHDCLGSGGKWKKRKKKASGERQNAVDKLIADSDADYNDLFMKGKMKKREKNCEKDGASDNKGGEVNIPGEQFDASLSLFSQ